MPLPMLALLALPVLEIATIIVAGQALGLWPTLALLILAGVVGVALLRRQGPRTWRAVEAAVARGEAPVGPLLHGAGRFLAGLLLLIPGFASDALALALLLPPLRAGLVAALLRRLVRRSGGPSVRRPPDIVDADYRELGEGGQELPDLGASRWGRRP